jgi:hypothetical protein
MAAVVPKLFKKERRDTLKPSLGLGSFIVPMQKPLHPV